MDFNKEKIFEFFKDLEFDEPSHVYSWKGSKVSVSVSGLIKKFEKPVDFIAISEKVAAKEGTTAEAVRKRWEHKKNKACRKGTEVHLFGELYPFNQKNMTPTNGYEEAIVKFWQGLPDFIVPVMMELQMYHKDFGYAGTADIILYDKRNNTFIIADYKTNEDLFKNFRGKTLKAPFDHLLHNSYNKYQLQLSFYQILFEQMGLQVSQRRLVWLRPSGEFTMYSCKDYTKELKECLENELVAA